MKKLALSVSLVCATAFLIAYQNWGQVKVAAPLAGTSSQVLIGAINQAECQGTVAYSRWLGYVFPANNVSFMNYVPWPVGLNVNVSQNSNIVTTVAPATTDVLDVGMTITGPDIPASTTISSITNNTTFVISKASTSAAPSPTPVTITYPFNANNQYQVSQFVGEFESGPCGSPLRQAVFSLQFYGTSTDITNGVYDKAWAALGQKLAQFSPAPILRLAWEMNLPAAREVYPSQEYVSIWQHVVNVMRNAGGTNIKFDWTPYYFCYGCGDDPTPFWPGPDYVDIIGLDFYDEYVPTSKNPSDAWQFYLYGGGTNAATAVPGSLSWQAQQAKIYGKQMSFPEWGVGGAGGANNSYSDTQGAYIVTQTHAWMTNANNVNGYQPYLYFFSWDNNGDTYCGTLNGSLPCPDKTGSPTSAYPQSLQSPQTAAAYLANFSSGRKISQPMPDQIMNLVTTILNQ